MNAPRIDGIDTSGYQTIVGDQPPLLFAIAKATEGQRTVDRKFFASVEHYQAQPHIETVGGYGWLRPDSPARKQAEHFLTTVAKCRHPLDFAVCDWERTSGQDRFPSCEEAEEWCSIVGARLPTLMYSAPWVPDFVRWRGRNPFFPLILANYSLSANNPRNGWMESVRWDATAWQWSSSQMVPGFTGRVDTNMAHKPEWFHALIPADPPPAPPIPKEDPDIMKIARIRTPDNKAWYADEQFIVGARSVTYVNLDDRKVLIETGHATLNPGTGEPWHLGIDKLGTFDLANPDELPTDSVLKVSDFRQRAA